MTEALSARLLNDRITANAWVVPLATRTQWLNNLQRRIAQHRTPDVALFQIQEIVHYLTLDQLLNGTIPVKAEYEVVKKLYHELESRKDPRVLELERGLQDPSCTFGENIKAILCKACGGECRMQARQKRAADEPTSYMIECKSCGKREQYR